MSDPERMGSGVENELRPESLSVVITESEREALIVAVHDEIESCAEEVVRLGSDPSAEFRDRRDRDALDELVEQLKNILAKLQR